MDTNKNGMSTEVISFKNSHPISECQNVYDAINKDDVHTLESVLQGISSLMLDHSFDFEDEENRGKYKHWYKIYLPFHLAVISCSRKVTEWMLRKNVDILKIDECGRNVLHNCVITGFYYEEREEKISTMIQWLEAQVGPDEMWRLLSEENSEGLRPIEFAAQQGTLKIMKAIFQLSGYVIEEKHQGGSIYRLHDVTEYEMGNRHMKSPVNMLAYLNKSRLQVPNYSKELLDPLIMSWINGKMKSNYLTLTVWIMLRLFLLGSYMFTDSDSSFIFSRYGNRTEHLYCSDLLKLHLGLDWIMVVSIATFTVCSVIIMCDIATAIKWKIQNDRTKSHDLNGKKTYITSAFFYQVSTGVFLLLIGARFFFMTYTILGDVKVTETMFTANYLMKMLLPILSLWSVSYFLQLAQK